MENESFNSVEPKQSATSPKLSSPKRQSFFFKNLWERWQSLAPYQHNRIFAAVVVGVVGVTLLLMFNNIIPGGRGSNVFEEQITLELWDVFDSGQAYIDIISKYQEEHPNVTIRYTKKKFDTYRQDILEALAEGRGPDIYVIHNTWLSLERSRLVSMNEALPEQSVPAFLSRFPDVVRFDFAREVTGGEQFLYAVPLSIDTLALYYNRTFFNSENLFEPPKTWEEFLEYVRVLRRIGPNNEVQLAAVALGGGDNVNRSTDILNLLMLQEGTRMNNEQRTRVTFQQGVLGEDGEQVLPGKDALEFYTSFADPSSENYTWDPRGAYSIDAFVQGKSVMMINYSFHRETVRAKSPHLDFALAPVPQPADRFDNVNYANYWGLAVAKQSQAQEVAWDFIHFMLEEENVKIYLEETDRPAALKSLVQAQIDDAELGVFASQILSAKSWVQGDNKQAEVLLEQAIDQVVSGERTAQGALSEVADKLNIILAELVER